VKKPVISLIAAMSSNRVIGTENRLPWSIPEDLKRFRALTAGHVIVMGRKTFESIGRPLPGRDNRIITRQSDYRPEGVKVYGSLEDALKEPIPAGLKEDEIFVIGGGEIYSQALPWADRIHLTVIEQEFKGDAFFPDLAGLNFVEVASENHYEPLPFRFLTLQREEKTAHL
jgi:dihydrofolate reductase